MVCPLPSQVTGQPSVLYYQTAIFEDAGFGDLASSASVIVATAKLLATLVTVSQVSNPPTPSPFTTHTSPCSPAWCASLSFSLPPSS